MGGGRWAVGGWVEGRAGRWTVCRVTEAIDVELEALHRREGGERHEDEERAQQHQLGRVRAEQPTDEEAKRAREELRPRRTSGRERLPAPAAASSYRVRARACGPLPATALPLRACLMTTRPPTQEPKQ